MNKKPYLQFRKDGTFRVLHITDLQESIYPRKGTIRLLCALLNNTRPDLVIMTGDQLKGYSPWFRLAGKSEVQNTIKMLSDPMERRRIPYAVTFGNYDIQCGISNEEQADLYRQQLYGICPEEGGQEKEADKTIRRSLLAILLCVFFYFMASNAVTSAFSKSFLQDRKRGNNLYQYRSYVPWWILCFPDTGLQPHDLCMGFYSRYWNGNSCYDHLSYDHGGGQ